MYALGIDLGTTFTAAAVWRDGRAEIASLGSRSAAVPSVVVLREDETIITGEAADRRAVSSPHRVAREFKRRLGDTTPILLAGVPYAAEALMAKLLQAVVEQVSAREGGPPSTVCISHPANWGPYKTDLLRQAAVRADLADAGFASEPVAAAVSYADQQRPPDGALVAVYDLGGGTFDTAVLRRQGGGFEILGRPEGIERLGGIDFDAAVFAHVARALGGKLEQLDDEDPAAISAVARLKEECTEAKEALSADTDTTIPVLLPNLVTEVRLTRAEFEAMVRPALQDTIDVLRRALRSADVTPEDLHSVLLVGGSSRMPIVAQLVGAELGRPVAVDVHPKHAVALGAAWLASGHAREEATSAPVARVEAGAPTEVIAPVAHEGDPAPRGQLDELGFRPRPEQLAPEPEPRIPAGPPPPEFSFARTGGSPPRPKHRRLRAIALVTVALVLVAGGAAEVIGNRGKGADAGANEPSASASAGAAAADDSAGGPGPLEVVAHRGGYEQFPHESLPALVAAAEAGDVAQADVVWTSDSVPIIIHETTTLPASKMSPDTPMLCDGGPYVIAETKWSVLKSKCRSVKSFSDDGRTYDKQYPIATFDEVIQAIAKVKKAVWSPEVTAENATPEQTQGLLDSIRKHGMARRTTIGSFFLDTLQQIQGQAETAKLTVQPILYIRPEHGQVPSAADLAKDHLYGVTIRADAVSKDYVSALQAEHLAVMAWGTKNTADWVKMKEAGVQAVFTDVPVAYRKWLEKAA
jgi:molecular chaperone DnaK